MKQIIQNFKTGRLAIEDMPAPLLRDGFILVRNRFSLISPGTEKTTIDTARASLIGKVQKRPDLVRQVMMNIKKDGLLATLRKVNTKLDTPKALGYSCCGIVLQSRDFEGRFKPGDRVACAGQDYAAHAEVVSVPQNLVVKIPDNLSFEEGAFSTIGAIALQGVRVANPEIGEKVCVIGLGLIGQIAAQILKLSGAVVFGIDISKFSIDLAKKLNIDSAALRGDENLYKLIDNFTNGKGFDKVVICASSSDNDPLLLATEIARKKGVLVLLGNTKIDIPRDPHFYKKELQLKMATSYGPGRYDPLYEEAGIDYPYSYVRFTANRNMEDLLLMAATGRLQLRPLISHIFQFDKALDAYNLFASKAKGEFCGILLEYQNGEEEELVSRIELATKPVKNINIGFIGAGSFAQSFLLPYLAGHDISLDMVVTTSGISAKSVAEKFKFNTAATNASEIISSSSINTVFIATRHNSHAEYVCEALSAKKNVFVEKPLCINIDELRKIASIYKGKSLFTVGFNRRFSPLSFLIRKDLKDLNGPLVMDFRVNAGYISDDHWAQNQDIGAGRIIGELCHFIDLMLYLSESMPKKIHAASLNPGSSKWRSDDNIAVTIEFANGSLGNIVYTSMGDKALAKERLEIFASGNTYLIDDFKQGYFFKNNKKKIVAGGGKGHCEEMDAFINAIREGRENPIPFESLLATTLSTFKITESLQDAMPKEVSLDEIY